MGNIAGRVGGSPCASEQTAVAAALLSSSPGALAADDPWVIGQGDGQNDVGAHVSAGRMGFVGPMLVAGYGAGRYSYRHELAGLGELSVQTGPRLRGGLAVGVGLGWYRVAPQDLIPQVPALSGR